MAKKTAKKGIVKGVLVIPRGRQCPVSIELVIPRPKREGCELTAEFAMTPATKAGRKLTPMSVIPRPTKKGCD